MCLNENKYTLYELWNTSRQIKLRKFFCFFITFDPFTSRPHQAPGIPPDGQPKIGKLALIYVLLDFHPD
jgi:hypothetical protein